MLGKYTLKQARNLAGYSQQEASELIGISTNTLRSYESGLTFPDVPTINRIEEIYNLKYSDIDFLCHKETV